MKWNVVGTSVDDIDAPSGGKGNIVIDDKAKDGGRCFLQYVNKKQDRWLTLWHKKHGDTRSSQILQLRGYVDEGKAEIFMAQCHEDYTSGKRPKEELENMKREHLAWNGKHRPKAKAKGKAKAAGKAKGKAKAKAKVKPAEGEAAPRTEDEAASAHSQEPRGRGDERE
eukprot:8287155-Pyramimonas_sp.AAC.1